MGVRGQAVALSGLEEGPEVTAHPCIDSGNVNTRAGKLYSSSPLGELDKGYIGSVYIISWNCKETYNYLKTKFNFLKKLSSELGYEVTLGLYTKGLPWWSSSEDPVLPVQGARV